MLSCSLEPVAFNRQKNHASASLSQGIHHMYLNKERNGQRNGGITLNPEKILFTISASKCQRVSAEKVFSMLC